MERATEIFNEQCNNHFGVVVNSLRFIPGLHGWIMLVNEQEVLRLEYSDSEVIDIIADEIAENGEDDNV